MTPRERALALVDDIAANYLRCLFPDGATRQKAADLIEAAINHEATERVAAWMLAHSYATGHGDTVDDLLSELVGQINDPT